MTVNHHVRCWEPNPGLLQDQPVLQVTEALYGPQADLLKETDTKKSLLEACPTQGLHAKIAEDSAQTHKYTKT